MIIKTKPTPANSLREGNHVLYNDEVCQVLTTKHVRSGARGKAYISVSVKGVLNKGTKYNFSYRSEEYVPLVEMVMKTAKYLFSVPDFITVLIEETQEVIEAPSDLLASETSHKLLDSCPKVDLCFAGDELIYISLPEKITVTIEETESVIRGQTASSSYKPASITGNIRIMVPQYTKVGDKVKISTVDLSYVERGD